ncbi:MAG: hypothetical protein ABEI86_11100 [Halobacteriaceae archaeon]
MGEIMNIEENRCSFYITPKQLGEGEDWFLNEEDVVYIDQEDEFGWICPHSTNSGESMCIFHQPPEIKNDKDVSEMLIQTVSKTRDYHSVEARRNKQFIGARFGDLILPYSVFDVEDNYPIDLRHAQVNGELDLRHSIVRHPMKLQGLHIQGPMDCRHLRVDNYVNMSGMDICEGISLVNSSFGGDFIFIQSEISENIRSQHVDFEGDADFSGTVVDGSLMIANVTVDGTTSFSKTSIEEQLLLDGGTFSGNVWLVDANISDSVYLINAKFQSDIILSDTTVQDEFSLRGSTVDDKLRFEQTDIGNLANFHQSNISAGTIILPANPTIFDLTGATIGDISFKFNPNISDRERANIDLFEYILFRDTTFEEFDFSQYHDELGQDWILHTIAPEMRSSASVDDHVDPITPSELETTYLKAKNGAISVGDQKAAGKFFRWEMIWRRRSYANSIITGHTWWQRLTASKNWLINALFGAIAGHGEHPRRVFFFSILLISIFAALFAGFWEGSSPPYHHPAGYFILSIESFVNLVLGGAEVVRNPWWLRLLAEIEGFAGSFLIALFVFALTRSIRR